MIVVMGSSVASAINGDILSTIWRLIMRKKNILLSAV